MADIFLSYAREDRIAAERIARALVERGYEVWWDSDIPAGPSYAQVIEQALASAKCVVVLWSTASVASSWVQDEAREGQERGVLVAARLADVKPPLGFRGHQLADLASWDGRGDDREFRRLVRGVEAHVPLRAGVPPAAPVMASVGVHGPMAEPEGLTEAALPSPVESTASGWQGEADTQPAESTSAPSVGEAVRGAAAAVGGALNGLAIAAVVAVVLVSGMMVLLREGDPNPAPSPASGASASGPSAPSPTADTSRFRSSDAWQLPDEPLLGFIEVPAGQFTMGSDSRQDSHATANEMPQHKVTLPAFLIGKYEVTVAQYKACADDGGCMPADRGALAGGGDLPVRWVSWHEALAYCAWLEGKLKSWIGTPPPIAAALAGRRDGGAWRITLPSEAEWERAARGTDARIYPWGADIDPSKANYSSANRGRPTPVGTFPAGASPVGAMDMAGNVWEWTRTLGDSRYPYVTDDGRERLDAPDSGGRVVRGGSFNNLDDKARAAYREGERPGGTFDSVGFRVVLSRRRP